MLPSHFIKVTIVCCREDSLKLLKDVNISAISNFKPCPLDFLYVFAHISAADFRLFS